LLESFIPAWRQENAVEVRPMLVGSGRALRMLEQGQSDIVISHAPEAEAAMLRKHAATWHYRKIMYNDFVLVGPATDPAAVRSSATLAEALHRLAKSSSRFVSRGDQSGTHERERALWKLVGVAPASDRLLTSGAGMAVTLRQASDHVGYTLTDRATFEQLKSSIELEIVWQGDARLLNTYAVIVNRRGPRGADAMTFANWLVEGSGRDAIAAYRIRESIRPFTVWPKTSPHDPQSVP
jgi:tungstate transport system substrate-binding protein